MNQLGTCVTRPWGNYKVIDVGENYQVKKLVVSPGGCLSLQSHEHRSEQWVIVNGSAKVTKDTDVKILNSEETINIPKKVKHRIENITDKDVVIIEVQLGDYLGEDDIIRYDDVYGRIDKKDI
jgi:Mannose-6-phosphate isomerase